MTGDTTCNTIARKYQIRCHYRPTCRRVVESPNAFGGQAPPGLAGGAPDPLAACNQGRGPTAVLLRGREREGKGSEGEEKGEKGGGG